MDGVLAVNNEHMLLEHDSLYFVAPYGQIILETKLRDMVSNVLGFLGLASFLSADLYQTPVGESNIFSEMVEHHHSPERRWQSRNQQSVITPGNTAADRSRGLA